MYTWHTCPHTNIYTYTHTSVLSLSLMPIPSLFFSHSFSHNWEACCLWWHCVCSPALNCASVLRSSCFYTDFNKLTGFICILKSLSESRRWCIMGQETWYLWNVCYFKSMSSTKFIEIYILSMPPNSPTKLNLVWACVLLYLHPSCHPSSWSESQSQLPLH